MADRLDAIDDRVRRLEDLLDNHLEDLLPVLDDELRLISVMTVS